MGAVTVDQRSLLAMGPPQLDPGVRFERIQLDDTSWVDLAARFPAGS